MSPSIRRSLPSTALARACLLASGAAQVDPWPVVATWPATEAYEQFGSALANLGDLDGDGIDELAVGSPAFTPPNVTRGGLVRVLAPAGATAYGTTSGPVQLDFRPASGGSPAALDVQGAQPGWAAVWALVFVQCATLTPALAIHPTTALRLAFTR